MNELELACRRQGRVRKRYIWLFWFFTAAAVVWFILSFGYEFSYIHNAWLSMIAALVCESRQQAAKGWLAGVIITTAAIGDKLSQVDTRTDPSQVVQANGATEEMNWRAHA